jgi:hypothetical protein
MSWVIEAFKELGNGMPKIKMPKRKKKLEKTIKIPNPPPREQPKEPEPAPQETEGAHETVTIEEIILETHSQVISLREDVRDIKVYIRLLTQAK